MRILDLDLDFFQEGRATHISFDEVRRDPDEYPPWLLEDALAFVETQCLVTDKLPGLAVEHHAELFHHFGEWIENGTLTSSFELVHVDAHADLGLGDSGYDYILAELAFAPLAERYKALKEGVPALPEAFCERGADALNDANWLAFAVACGWLSELTYVFNGIGPAPGDLLRYLMKDFDVESDHLQVHAIERGELRDSLMRIGPPRVERADPAIPFAAIPWRDYQATRPFDVVCLTRSPAYTSSTADPIFDTIRERFIDERRF